MMLLQTVEPGRATGKVARIYAAFDRAGEVPLPMRLLSASPGLQEQQFQLLGYFMSHPHLGFPLLAAIRYVAARLSCHDACMAFNGTLLQRLGMSPAEVEALAEDGACAALEDREAALLAFVRKALAAPEAVSAGDVATLRAMKWTDADLLDAVAHGANLIASSVLHKAFVRGLEER